MSDDSETPTGTAPRPREVVPAPTPGPRTPASGSATPRHLSRAAEMPSGRFHPGQLLADRYRIVGPLGKGGMGEVWRADDLRLGQPVALKFLPEALVHDPERLARFYGEVRVAREIAHPAVCRVHDIGEHEGQPFLSMEYVDGENLAALSRRIGRLPGEKALEIARQVCAGLAAAHDKGILHRDLKPENIMLDGRGKARLTDFGLAAFAEGVGGSEVRSGTPAYMAPEQLAGREVTVRSDLYALGLVLYELFTGRRAFDGKTLTELSRQHQEDVPPPPSTLAPDLDPAVERVILRCLEKDPARRPPSALGVSAALPGGDPLAAALAAGQTPSPEMVAAAGGSEGLAPARAWALFAAAVLCGLGALMVGLPRHVQNQTPFALPPAVLEDRARAALRELGHTMAAVDTATGLGVDVDQARWIEQRTEPDRWERIRAGRPPFIAFQYRQSPRPLITTAPTGRVTWFNPPILVSGMAGVEVDMEGRPIEFYSVTPQLVEELPDAPAPEPDWGVVFRVAGLDRARFEPSTPRWAPPFDVDRRVAFEGTLAERPDLPVRLEAAAHRGRVVYFQLISPWTRAERQQLFERSPAQRNANALGLGLFVGILGTATVLAFRHLRSGRGDRRGAARLGWTALLAMLVDWAVVADHVPDLNQELGLLFTGAAWSLLAAAALWVLYVAVEPSLRRRWPHVLISWTRLLAGGWSDPLVGRHVLYGLATGAGFSLLFLLSLRLREVLGLSPLGPQYFRLDALLGPGLLFDALLDRALDSVAVALGLVLLLFVLRVILRGDLRAGAVAALLFGLQPALQIGTNLPLMLLLMAAVMAVPIYVLMRFGLVALAANMCCFGLLLEFPLVLVPGHWAFPASAFVLVVLLAFGAWALRTSVGSQPLFGGGEVFGD
ncbi:MAG: serine/threonine protein kinase [Vicinamibacteria bacterium]|nr:serine/threonine protein kinase [Vicinamibacteria bacterium]